MYHNCPFIRNWVGLNRCGPPRKTYVSQMVLRLWILIAVKLAFNIKQRDALRNEYKIYRYLRSKGVSRGIATTLGFFDDSEGTACTLVTAGVPVSLIAGFRLVRFLFLKLRFIQLIYFQIRKSALSTLECIHRAGILHGDIRHDNILIGDSGITIIDFRIQKNPLIKRPKIENSLTIVIFLGWQKRNDSLFVEVGSETMFISLWPLL